MIEELAAIEAQAGPEAVLPKAVALEAQDAPGVAVEEFTLQIEPQPSLVKVAAVKVETSSVFAHGYDNGSGIIDDDEGD